MANRRAFIEAGAAACLASALASVSLGRLGRAAPESLRGGRGPLEGGTVDRGTALKTVLFDERFAAARRFGEAAKRLGLAVLPIRADVTEVWYSRLYPLWHQSPAPIAGLTAYAAMFCLERLAWDHGLRMIHGDAYAEEDNHRTRDERDAGAAWPLELASRLAHGAGIGWNAGPLRGVAAGPLRGVAASALTAAAGGPLHSWLIATRADAIAAQSLREPRRPRQPTVASSGRIRAHP